MRRPRVRDDLVSLENYHSPQVDVPVRLNTNESPTPPPPGFADALAGELSRLDWNRYPDRAATALREAIAEHHGVDPSQVLAANGSNEVLQLLCLAYGGHGRVAVDFQPTYLMHAQIASITGTTVRHGRRLADFTLDADEAVRTVQENDADITFLCSPNNPTGVIESPDAVQAVADTAPGIVVVDEAYGQFADWSAVLLLDDDLPLVVTRTFSKTWSMAAARLGYLLAPTWLVTELEKVTLPYHLDAVKQLAGAVALRYETEMRDRVDALVDERERLVSVLDTLPVEHWPSGANFVLFRPSRKSGSAVWNGLLQRGVLVRDASSWPSLDDCLRVTVGTPEEDDRFLEALTEVLR